MQSDFGQMPDGRTVHKLSIARGALAADILTLGAVLHSVRLDPVPHDLTLGQGSLADYLGPMCYHGAVVAPVANRISGARATIAGQEFSFQANQDQRISLHSGDAGTYGKLWQITDRGHAHVTLDITLPDGEGGFPGTRHIRATYCLSDVATLRLDITATTDAPTLFNAVNHSYWNLDGTADWTGHSLRVAADRYLPTSADITPTGEIAAVAGSAYDFTSPRRIAPQQPPLDTCFCLGDRRGPLRDALALRGQSGVEMTVATTEPGIQIYDGRAARRPGRGLYEGLAIEPQSWPDAPNHPPFPSILLLPDAPYHQTSEWRFTAP